MIAAVGILILSLSLLGFGFSYSSVLKAEKESIDGLIQLTERIRSRIECFRQPLDEIYEGFSHRHLEGIGFTDDIKKHGLFFALKSKGRLLGISSDILEASKKFASDLGKSYSIDQIRLCEAYLDELKKEMSNIEGSLSQKTKLSLSIAGAAAAMAAILFL